VAKSIIWNTLLTRRVSIFLGKLKATFLITKFFFLQVKFLTKVLAYTRWEYSHLLTLSCLELDNILHPNLLRLKHKVSLTQNTKLSGSIVIQIYSHLLSVRLVFPDLNDFVNFHVHRWLIIEHILLARLRNLWTLFW